MLFVFLFAFLIVPVTSNDIFEKLREPNRDKVDYSSMTVCWVLGGKIENVDPGNDEKGYKCKVKVGVSTATDRQAWNCCRSKIPYYIIAAESSSSGDDQTTCTFQMNLKCDDGYWQIHGRCYKVFNFKYTWAEAQAKCINGVDKLWRPKVANFYAQTLSIYLREMVDINDPWVFVPNLKDYFVNGEGNAAIYVQNGAYKYDVKPGTILMDDPNSKHEVLCEYTPMMTMAEMFYLGKIYNEIYPIQVYENGAIIPSANLMTVHQTELLTANNQKDPKQNGVAEQFTTKNLLDTCMSIGNILNVNSYPITAIEEEFNDVKNLLNDQRFYLTSAYKNDGCAKTDYKQRNEKGTDFQLYQNSEKDKKDYCNAHSFSFQKTGRYPSMAAMRAPTLCALHTFNWEYSDCPKDESGVYEVVRYERDDKRVFCHYINNKEVLPHQEAKDRCDKLNAALSGIDSPKEFIVLDKHVNPQYPTDSNTHYYKNHLVDDHYWLGGTSPCTHDCYKGNGELYAASWDKAVAVNTGFLNGFEHKGWNWTMIPGVDQYVSFRKDLKAFHIHQTDTPYQRMFYICGKSANLKRSERLKAPLKSGGN